MYDEVVIPDVVAGVHPKSAITKRNRWMVEKSDIIYKETLAVHIPQ